MKLAQCLLLFGMAALSEAAFVQKHHHKKLSPSKHHRHSLAEETPAVKKDAQAAPAAKIEAPAGKKESNLDDVPMMEPLGFSDTDIDNVVKTMAGKAAMLV